MTSTPTLPYTPTKRKTCPRCRSRNIERTETGSSQDSVGHLASWGVYRCDGCRFEWYTIYKSVKL